MGCDHGQAVAGRHNKLATHNHIAVSVTIARSTHVRRIGGEQMGDQVFGIHRIRVRVQTTEIFEWCAIDHGSCGCTQLALQQGFGIRAAHRAHGVIAQGEAARKQLADGVKVKQAAHHFGIVGYGVNHQHLGAADVLAAQSVQADVGRIHGAYLTNDLGAFENRLGDLLRCGAAVGHVVFDAEVTLRTTGVVTGGQHDTATGAMAADHSTDCRGRQNAALPDEYPGIALGCGHTQDGLNGHAVVKAAIAPHHQRQAGSIRQHIE